MAKSVGDGAKRRRPLLSEETADADLSKMSGSDWQPLLELRRRIDQAESFTIKSENSVWPIWTEVIKDFHKIVYELPVVVSFDWKAWDSGRAALRDPSHDFGEESLVDLCKMITTIVRAERFNEGFLPGKFKDGTISRILDAISRHIDR